MTLPGILSRRAGSLAALCPDHFVCCSVATSNSTTSLAAFATATEVQSGPKATAVIVLTSCMHSHTHIQMQKSQRPLRLEQTLGKHTPKLPSMPQWYLVRQLDNLESCRNEGCQIPTRQHAPLKDSRSSFKEKQHSVIFLCLDAVPKQHWRACIQAGGAVIPRILGGCRDACRLSG